jgi:AbrB family looped-hinge helix DNA binding protein
MPRLAVALVWLYQGLWCKVLGRCPGHRAIVEAVPGLPRTHDPGNVIGMAIAHSKLTAQGQISVPAEVRRRLGVGPGAVLEWDEDGDSIVVRRAGRYTSEDVHRALFPEEPPQQRSLEEMEEGIRRYVRGRHARR